MSKTQYRKDYLQDNDPGVTLLSRQYRYVCPAAICIYVTLQLLIGLKSNIGDSYDAQLSTRTYYFYSGGGSSFVISAVNQMIKIFECRTHSRDHNSEGIYFAVLTVNLIAASSFILTFALNWGGICKDVLGVESTTAQWAEWLVTVPLMVYMTLAMEDKPALFWEDIVIIIVFILAIAFGFFLNFNEMPIALGYILFMLGCCSISVTTILDYLSVKSFEKALSSQNQLLNSTRIIARASKRRTLTRLFTVIFPLFPLTHILAQTKVIDREGTFVAYAICSLIAKLLFASSVSDTHINVIEGINKITLSSGMADNKIKRKFLEKVFHEVRAPLNAISMGLTVCKEDHQHLTASSREALTMMKGATNFIYDVLSLQKVENETFDLLMEPFSMEALVQRAIASVKDTSDSRRINIIVQSSLNCHVDKGSMTSTPCRVVDTYYVGDKQRIEHVVVTFLNNAIKFSAVCSQITVRLTGTYQTNTSNTAQQLAQLAAAKHNRSSTLSFCINFFLGDESSDGNGSSLQGNNLRKVGQEPSDICELTLLVIDSGIGIVPSEVAGLFTPYSQRSVNILQTKSTGLKLMLAKEIIILHGGEVVVKSEKGLGSSFGFCIPFKVEFKVAETSVSIRGKSEYDPHMKVSSDGSIEWRRPSDIGADSTVDVTIRRQSSHMEAVSLSRSKRRSEIKFLIIEGKLQHGVFVYRRI